MSLREQELARGRVSFGAQEEYRVLLDTGGEASIEVAAEPAGKLRAYGELPVVGDYVRLRLVGGLGLIESVEPRRTVFARKVAGRSSQAQLLAANVDTAFLVCGLDGDFNLRRLERYLVLTAASGAAAVVVLNKADLASDVAARVAEVRAMTSATVVAISARAGAEDLMPWLDAESTVVLLGSSGAGKSTIANALGAKGLATNEVRAHDSRGRHTTTARMLIRLPSGAFLIDTPGMRELGIWAGEGAMGEAFADVEQFALSCRYQDCSHDAEPGCAVRQALKSGVLDAGRWASYTKLRRESAYLARSVDNSAAQEEKRRWKSIHKELKRVYREREK